MQLTSSLITFNSRLAELMVKDFEKEAALMLPHSGQAVCDDFKQRVTAFHNEHYTPGIK